MSNSTSKLIERMRHREEWDTIVTDVPIFREHHMYEVGQGEKAYKVPVLPGETPPEGARYLYSVDKGRLDKIAAAINGNLDKHEKPIKLFAGHTRGPGDQLKQPPLVGYGGRARRGLWGPENIEAVLTPLFIEKGCQSTVKELPERSPEFYPATNDLTALALLKTDPKLPMGMLSYQHAAYTRSDGAVLYGRGPDMAEINEDPKAGAKPAENTDGLDDLTPEEARTAARYAKHYETHHPVFKYMCGKYAAETAAAGPESGQLPGEAPPEKGKEEEDAEAKKREMEKEKQEMANANNAGLERYAAEMQQSRAVQKQQAQEIAALRQKDRKNEVTKKLVALSKEVVLTEKSHGRLVERYMKADEKEWASIDEEVKESYQRRDGDPTQDPFLPAAVTYENDFATADDFDPMKDQLAVDRYFRENPNARPDDEHDWQQAEEYAVKHRREKLNGAAAAK